ncbi:MAG: 3'-5' exonuclease [Pontiellaceae bacterium]|jgi:DNA polymerase-3 subunit epsilon|nr:3'-5' exonuclease [Pontiellaceae bacterium]
MIPFFQRSESPLIQAYREGTKSGIRKNTPVNELRFVVIDAETSGLKVAQDRILSIALFEIANGQIDITRSRKWMVFQPETAPTAATAIHGILPCETRSGITEKKVLEELLPLLTGAILVGHHVRFDLAMIQAALLRNLGTPCYNRMIDTARIAMHELTAFRQTGYANQRPPSLDEVCAQLNLPPVARHTAEGDAFTAAEVFLLLCGRIRRRLKNRPLQLRDLPVKRFKSTLGANRSAPLNNNPFIPI